MQQPEPPFRCSNLIPQHRAGAHLQQAIDKLKAQCEVKR